MLNIRGLGESISLFRIAADNLNKVRVVATGAETFRDGTDKISRRPNDMFRAFQHDSVSREDGS